MMRINVADNVLNTCYSFDPAQTSQSGKVQLFTARRVWILPAKVIDSLKFYNVATMKHNRTRTSRILQF